MPEVSNFPWYHFPTHFLHPYIQLNLFLSVWLRIFLGKIFTIFSVILFILKFLITVTIANTPTRSATTTSTHNAPPPPTPHHHTHPHSTLDAKEIGCLREGFGSCGSSDGRILGECGQSSCQAIWKILLLFETYKMFQCGEKLSISKLHFHYRHKEDDSQKWVFGTDGCIYSKVRTS